MKKRTPRLWRRAKADHVYRRASQMQPGVGLVCKPHPRLQRYPPAAAGGVSSGAGARLFVTVLRRPCTRSSQFCWPKRGLSR